MRKRIFAVVMAVVVAVGCVGYRPQKAYAGEMLAVGASEVLYALFLSMGVIVSANASHEDKMKATQEIYDALPPKGKAAVLGIMGASEVADGLYSWSSGFNRSDLVTLWDSVMSVKADQISIAPAIAGYMSYSASSPDISNLSLGSCSDSPYVVFYYNTHSIVYALLPSGYCLMYTYQHSNGKVTVNKFVRVSSDTELFFNLDRLTGSDGREVFNIDCVFKGSSFSYNSRGGALYTNYDGSLMKAGVAWKGADGAFIWGSISPTVLNYYDGVSIYDEGLLDCDTWADSLGRVGEVDKEIGIITGKDLSGYNTSESAYDDLITGVNNPVVENPVKGDLGVIAGGLASILKLLKAIPRTIVGEGSLDFSAFNDIKLSGLFPFCIPFDLINSFKVFNVPPKEPVWTVEFSKTPMVGMPDMVIDMREYNWLFSIGRFFIYISFVIGLIMITRNIIKG